MHSFQPLKEVLVVLKQKQELELSFALYSFSQVLAIK